MLQHVNVCVGGAAHTVRGGWWEEGGGWREGGREALDVGR
jgi:hypothetical protein